MAGATRQIVINAPIEKVFAVISDLESYPQFLKEVKSVKVTKEGPHTLLADYEVEMIKRIKYTLRLEVEAPKKLSWKWLKGEMMKDNVGGWVLESLGPNQTQATYSVEVTLGPLVPKSLVNAMVETSLPAMLDAFKARSEKLS